MPPFLLRLGLVNGAVLTLGEKWLEGDEHPVGLICERLETIEQVDGQVSERTPAHFEVWMMPVVLFEQLWTFYKKVYEVSLANPGQFDRVWSEADQAIAMLAKSQGDMKLTCRRVYLEQVAFTEERPTFAEAHSSIHSFFADKIDEPEESSGLDKFVQPLSRLPRPEQQVQSGPSAG